jgi:uncharacterized protein YbbK (DUF523 family)
MSRRLPTSGPVLVSACLAGRECTYQGTHRANAEVLRLVAEGRAVLVCPEEEGGLGTPRPEAEVIGGTGADVLDGRARVQTIDGLDVTEQYTSGARTAVERAARTGCVAAILKARSPACGCGAIHAGTFDQTLRDGDGVAAAALRRSGIDVMTDEEVERGAE